MKKITLMIIMIITIIINSQIMSYAFTVTSEQHETGKVILVIEGYSQPPYQIYRSLDNENYTYLGEYISDRFIEYGLEGGQTYYYKIIDDNMEEAIVRYSVPILFRQVLPLTIKMINDNQATIEWDIYDFKECDIFLNDSYIKSLYDNSTYTISGLSPNTEYAVHIRNQFSIRSNTITFRTSNYFDKLDKLLRELFIKDLHIDSDSDGLPDILEPIGAKMDTIINKLGGTTVTGVRNIIDSVDYSTGIDDLQDMPKISTSFRGLNITVFDLDDTRLIGMMSTIRLLILALLTVTFIFLLISFFDIKFKV